MTPSVVADRRPLTQEYDLFVGMDTDKKSLSVTCLDHQGHEHALRLPADADNLLAHLERRYGNRRALFVYEAGPTGWGLYDALRARGQECLVVSPASVPVAPGARHTKTNRLDSRRLAYGLRGGELSSVRVPDEIYRELRHLAHRQADLAKQVGATKVKIKALLLQEGLAFPEARPASQWTQAVREALGALPCHRAVRFVLDSLLDQLAFAQGQLNQARKEMVSLCESDPETAESLRFVQSIPGVGPVIGCYLIARVGDWRQMQHPGQLAAYCGLAPRERSTGETVRRGSITRAGDPVLRSLLIEGAWTALGKDPGLKAFYEGVRKRQARDKAARIAVVAVARKLCTRLYAVLTQRREYELAGDPRASRKEKEPEAHTEGMSA